MVMFNASTREITAKIVYYGPALCGKTTNLNYIHGNLPAEKRSKLISLATKADRTIFFDFLPLDMGEISGFRIRVQLYTVPGQVYYGETRKRVLRGADGVVFVADSQKVMKEANREYFENMRQNLKENGINPDELPIVLQYNKRDLKGILSIEDLDKDLNQKNLPFFESVATEGIGVEDTLDAIAKKVITSLIEKYKYIDFKEVPKKEAIVAKERKKDEDLLATMHMSRDEIIAEMQRQENIFEQSADENPFQLDESTENLLGSSENSELLETESQLASVKEPPLDIGTEEDIEEANIIEEEGEMESAGDIETFSSINADTIDDIEIPISFAIKGLRFKGTLKLHIVQEDG